MTGDPADLGLRVGEPVRWRRHDGGHWQEGTVIGLERDGSIAVRDADGAWRSLVADRLEARRPNPRGRLRWQVVADAAAAPAQLTLWEPAPQPRPARSRPHTKALRPRLRAR